MTDTITPVYSETHVTNSPSAGLTDLVSELALSAVTVQEALDAGRTATLQRLSGEDVVRLGTLGLGSLAAPLQRINEFRIATAVSVRTAGEKDLQVLVRPVNLAFRLARGRREQSECRIEICVGRTPVPDPGTTSRRSAAAAMETKAKGGSSE